MERPKFHITRLEHEDPTDYRSETYQEEIYRRSSFRAGWPGARLGEHASQSEQRTYLIVTKGNLAQRIIRSPFMDEVEWSKLSPVLRFVLEDLAKEYSHDKGYDLIIGGPSGCLLSIQEKSPFVSFPKEVKIEAIEID